MAPTKSTAQISLLRVQRYVFFLIFQKKSAKNFVIIKNCITFASLLKSGFSAVGSARRSGRRGRWFESSNPDKRGLGYCTQYFSPRFSFSCCPSFIFCGVGASPINHRCWFCRLCKAGIGRMSNRLSLPDKTFVDAFLYIYRLQTWPCYCLLYGKVINLQCKQTKLPDYERTRPAAME